MKSFSIFSGIVYGLLSMILIPGFLISISDYFQFPWFSNIPTQFIGAICVFSGGLLLLYSTRLFAKHGKGGSPLPFDPPKRLVTVGVYKYIRNPMFTASAMIWFGEFLFFGSSLLFFYAIAWVLFNHIHLITQDEKWLEQRYGKEYLEYKKRTTRYIPKFI